MNQPDNGHDAPRDGPAIPLAHGSADLDESGLFLEKLTLRGFRSFDDTEVPIRQGLTVVVGENNAGKSNLIDALRLSTEPLGGRRTRYFQVDDMTTGWTGPVEITTQYGGATWAQKARLLKGLDINTGTIVFSSQFEVPADPSERVAVKRLAGPANISAYEPSTRIAVSHVYVPPLRDAKRDLDTASAVRLAAIMAQLVGADERKELQDKAKKYFSKLAALPAIKTPESTLGSLLTRLTEPVAGQTLSIGFDEPTERKLASGLRMRMADAGFAPEDLAASGSGYANLLYLASIVLELARIGDSELTLLLVEEPEAHLHPQLQGVLLDFLRSYAKAGAGSLNMGRVQVILTTHSPNIASAAGIEEILSLSRKGPPGRRPTTSPVALWQLGLEPVAIGKLNRYLTVTRSSLLFSKRVYVAEGLSETLLLPALAESWARQNLSGEDGQRAMRALAGVTLVPVDSTDFSPYVHLLLGGAPHDSLAERVFVITDGDPETNDNPAAILLAGSARRTRLMEMAIELGRENDLIVAVGETTLEADFIVNSTRNALVAKNAFLEQHPRSSAKWDRLIGDATDPTAIYRHLKSGELAVHKGRFSQDIAAAIAGGSDVDIPNYLVPVVSSFLRIS